MAQWEVAVTSQGMPRLGHVRAAYPHSTESGRSQPPLFARTSGYVATRTEPIPLPVVYVCMMHVQEAGLAGTFTTVDTRRRLWVEGATTNQWWWREAACPSHHCTVSQVSMRCEGGPLVVICGDRYSAVCRSLQVHWSCKRDCIRPLAFTAESLVGDTCTETVRSQLFVLSTISGDHPLGVPAQGGGCSSARLGVAAHAADACASGPPRRPPMTIGRCSSALRHCPPGWARRALPPHPPPHSNGTDTHNQFVGRGNLAGGWAGASGSSPSAPLFAHCGTCRRLRSSARLTARACSRPLSLLRPPPPPIDQGDRCRPRPLWTPPPPTYRIAP